MKSCIMTIGLMAVLGAISWAVTCGIIALVCLCFGWAFSWLIATGVWLVMILLRSIFKQSK